MSDGVQTILDAYQRDGAGAFFSVLEERCRQDAKWGEQNHEPFAWLAILLEEIGEYSQEALGIAFGKGESGTVEGLRKECVQVAAVALAMVECIDRGKWQKAAPAEEGRP